MQRLFVNFLGETISVLRHNIKIIICFNRLSKFFFESDLFDSLNYKKYWLSNNFLRFKRKLPNDTYLNLFSRHSGGLGFFAFHVKFYPLIARSTLRHSR